MRYMIELLATVPGLTADRHLPPIANHVPHLRLTWTEDAFKFKARNVVEKLMQGDPPIAHIG